MFESAYQASGDFPSPPIDAIDSLLPISSWEAMYAETQVTGVDFEQFWFESVMDGVAYFFRWEGDLRSTVLVVWTDEGPTHIEARTFGDEPVVGTELDAVTAHLVLLFRKAGYWSHLATH